MTSNFVSLSLSLIFFLPLLTLNTRVRASSDNHIDNIGIFFLFYFIRVFIYNNKCQSNESGKKEEEDEEDKIESILIVHEFS